jgi:hypothetical protein
MFKYQLFSKNELIHTSSSYDELVDLMLHFQGILEDLKIELSY